MFLEKCRTQEFLECKDCPTLNLIGILIVVTKSTTLFFVLLT